MADFIESTLFVLAVFVFVIVLPFKWLRRGRRAMHLGEQKVHPERYEDLRAKYLTLPRGELCCPSPASPAEPWGVIMEFGDESAIATTVTLSDGTSRVLRSTGGGFFSAGPIEPARTAGDAFLNLARQIQSQTSPVSAFPSPRTGQVVFYLRTDNGVTSASAPEDELADGHHRLSPLFQAGLLIFHEFLQLQKQRPG